MQMRTIKSVTQARQHTVFTDPGVLHLEMPSCVHLNRPTSRSPFTRGRGITRMHLRLKQAISRVCREQACHLSK